ncbi:MAG: glycine zipper 2TM domain-containing protein [Sulfuricaulis sp.]
MSGFEGKKKLIAITAASAFAVGAVAAAVLTGVFPHSTAAPTEQMPSPVASTPSPAAPPEAKAAYVTPPVTRAHIHKRPMVKSHPPVSQMANADAAPPPPAMAPCENCGVVQSIESFTEKGPASGGGAVTGGLLGGILGHQLGRGRGKELATVAGMVGGALAGNAMEKNANQVTRYHVAVLMSDGSRQIFTLDAAPRLAAGERVVVVNGAPLPE